MEIRPLLLMMLPNALGLAGDGGEVLGDLLPVVYADEAGGGQVVGGGVEDSLTFKAEEVFGQVVNEVVGAEDGLVAAEDVMRGRDEGKVALQPAVLGAEGVGDGHGLGGDEDFKTGGEVFEDVLSAGHEGQVLEEILGVKEGAELLLAVEGGDLPQSLAGQVQRGNVLIEGLVVAAQMLRERVCYDLIHVHADAPHCRSSRLRPGGV